MIRVVSAVSVFFVGGVGSHRSGPGRNGSGLAIRLPLPTGVPMAIVQRIVFAVAGEPDPDLKHDDRAGVASPAAAFR